MSNRKEKRSFETQRNHGKQSNTGYIPSYVQEGEKCAVCGDKTTGYHYGALTCEGCKGFFRRTIQKSGGQEPALTCKKEGNCDISYGTRNRCQSCRFKKCIAAKMDVSSVLDDEQRVNLRRKKETNKLLKRKKERQTCTKDEMEVLISFGKQYKDTNFNDCYKFFAPKEMEEMIKYKNVISPSLKQMINFVWSIPDINKVDSTDLVTIFVDRSINILLIQLAEIYDSKADQLCFSDFHLKSTDLEKYPQFKDLFLAAKHYSKLLADDGVVLSCLCAIHFLCPENPTASLKDLTSLEAVKENLINLLVKYCEEKQISVKSIFGELCQFVDIRYCWSNTVRKLTQLEDDISVRRIFESSFDLPNAEKMDLNATAIKNIKSIKKQIRHVKKKSKIERTQEEIESSTKALEDASSFYSLKEYVLNHLVKSCEDKHISVKKNVSAIMDKYLWPETVHDLNQLGRDETQRVIFHSHFDLSHAEKSGLSPAAINNIMSIDLQHSWGIVEKWKEEEQIHEEQIHEEQTHEEQTYSFHRNPIYVNSQIYESFPSEPLNLEMSALDLRKQPSTKKEPEQIIWNVEENKTFVNLQPVNFEMHHTCFEEPLDLSKPTPSVNNEVLVHSRNDNVNSGMLKLPAKKRNSHFLAKYSYFCTS